MSTPGVHIETVRSPGHYSREQIDHACQVAYQMQRGKLCLCVEPAGRPLLEDLEDDDA